MNEYRRRVWINGSMYENGMEEYKRWVWMSIRDGYV